MAYSSLNQLLQAVRACQACQAALPFEPRPVLRAHPQSRLLIVGQAPGVKVHQTGIPWNDASGDRLRAWLNLSRNEFYNEQKIAIIPMGFCYPGKGSSGDLPPRRECAQLWLDDLLHFLPNIRLTLLIGQYAQAHYLKGRCKKNLSETVAAWQNYLPDYLPLPHPSPRNTYWLQQRPWFETQVIPELQRLVHQLLNSETNY